MLLRGQGRWRPRFPQVGSSQRNLERGAGIWKTLKPPVCVCSVASAVSDSFAIPWTVPSQALLSMGFPRQEYWSGFHFLFQGNLPHWGIKPTSLYHLCCRQILYLPSHQGSPKSPICIATANIKYGLISSQINMNLNDMLASNKQGYWCEWRHLIEQSVVRECWLESRKCEEWRWKLNWERCPSLLNH